MGRFATGGEELGGYITGEDADNMVMDVQMKTAVTPFPITKRDPGRVDSDFWLVERVVGCIRRWVVCCLVYNLQCLVENEEVQIHLLTAQ